VNDPTITLTLPLSRVNQVLAALAEQPFKAVADTIGDVQRQAQAALQPPAAEAI
jgi:hypothetical protein